MALTTKQRAKQLQSLLDAVERGNKRDAVDYTGGHLNEANLYKPVEFSTHKDWEGGKRDAINCKKPSRLPQSIKKDTKRNGMTDILTQFSVGNDSFLPKVKKKPSKFKENENYWGGEVTGSVDEQALIEEIDSRRFMLNRSQPTRMLKSWATEDEDNDHRVHTKSVPPKHEFFSVKSGATKRDQLRDFKLFETETIRKQDLLTHKVLSGEQAVIDLEKQLNRVRIVTNIYDSRSLEG